MITDLARYKREWVASRRSAFFADKACIKCGSSEALELDHIDPRTKISSSIWSWSEKRRTDELLKCQILCHDCHVVKTRLNRDVVGSRKGSSKLTEESVLEIRSKFQEGQSKRSLAREYGVDEKAIRSLIARETWQHI